MPTLRRMIALLLLSLWLPATMHCALEAAGLEVAFICHDHETQTAEHCADDACHALEGEAYTAVTLAKLVGEVTLSVVALLPEPLEQPAVSLSPERTDVPRELGRSWQFLSRAAPLARAPSTVV